MKKIRNRKPSTVVLVAVIALMVAVGSAVAWLTVGDTILDRYYSLSNFDVYAEVNFAGAVNPPETYRNADGSISVDVTNDTAENYIGKLRVDAYYKGRGLAYIRLKTVQQWKGPDGKILQSAISIPYAIATPYLSTDTGNQAKWFDNRKDDYCIYFANRITVANETYTTIPIITAGFDAEQMAAIVPSGTGTTLNIAFTLEAVQVNRYPQFWDLETLPWLG